MKRLILSAVSVLMLASAIAPSAAQAKVAAATPPANADVMGMGVTPFNLVFLAYQGFLEEDGIPKFANLVDSYRQGATKAEDLIRVAVAMQRLPENTLSDRSYVQAVDHQLRSLLMGQDE